MNTCKTKGHENKELLLPHPPTPVVVNQHNSCSAIAAQAVTFSVATSYTTNLATLA
jgi:hypothetical protein